YAGTVSAAVAEARAGLSRRTRNHAAYNAGTKTSVSAVATTRPPMIEMAIGPQNTLRVSGIIASTAAAAVSTTGRERRTVASTMAVHGAMPRAMSWSIWSTRMIDRKSVV